FVAMAMALHRLVRDETLARSPLTGTVAAVSVGIVDGKVALDLPYEEDHRAEVDLNLVMTGGGRFVEVQGTAEGKPFTPAQLDKLVAIGGEGIKTLIGMQRAVLREAGVALPRG